MSDVSADGTGADEKADGRVAVAAASAPGDVRFQRDCGNVDWLSVKQMYRLSNFDNGRPPAMLRQSFEGSFAVCFAVTATGRVVGTGRAISDGVVSATLFDVCVHPDFRRLGIGTGIVRALMRSLNGQYVLFVTDVPGFYEAMKLGFRREPNAMAVP